GHACFTVGTPSYPGLPTSGETDPRVVTISFQQPASQAGGAGSRGSGGVGLKAAGA
ncbi:unnamed protein product, partial [Ectocarpus sp. 13 AM-2016]